MKSNSAQPPLTFHDLKTLGDPGAAITAHRQQGEGREVDWTSCALVQAYGLPGEPGHSRTSTRRRALVA